MNFHLKSLQANLRGGKGGTFMIGPGRHLASLRHWMAPGARSKFGAPMFEFEVFRQQMYCIEQVILTLLGLFDSPRSYSAPP